MKITLIVFVLLHVAGYWTPGYAQQSIEQLLSVIESNNKELQLLKQEMTTGILENSIGLNPANPQISYDYMIGSPAGAGNQTDIVIAQSLDFPTVYTQKKKLSNELNKTLEFHYLENRQAILLDAELLYIDQIYRNKLKHVYLQRFATLEKLLATFTAKLEKGLGTIIEVNKAQLQLIQLTKEMQFNASLIRQNNEKLSALNGNIPLELNDTIFPGLSEIQELESYLQWVDQNDPLLQQLEQQKAVALQQIELSKALTLPKFELGYHYQGILGQRFNGTHLALTIPLWENKNVVKTARSTAQFATMEVENKRIVRNSELKTLYDQYLTISETVTRYQTVFQTFSNEEILLKALNLGELTAIEYFNESSFYYTAYQHYLEAQMQQQKIESLLYKYKL